MKINLFILLLLCTYTGNAQSRWQSYKISVKGDTINCIDTNGQKQGPWVDQVPELRGEPGYESEGRYVNDKKEGTWRLFSLIGDPIGVENYKWGNKDGQCLYYNMRGELLREENWKSFHPEKKIDTVVVEDVEKPGNYIKKVIHHEGAAVRHGEWRLFDPISGHVIKTEKYFLGALEEAAPEAITVSPEKKQAAKPKEVLEYEKQNQKKKVKVRDGRTY